MRNISRVLLAILFTVCLLSLVPARGDEELHLIYSEPDVHSRAPASAWPEELASDFEVEAPSNREPASLAHKSKAGKGKQKKSASHEATGRRSNLPSAISDGFEIRVKANGLVTTFWVVKRGEKFDLLYANSAGSRSAVSLSQESFHAIHEQASRIPASDVDVRKCADNSMQLHISSAGHQERTATFCLDSRSKAAEQLRSLGNALVVWVR